MIVPLGLVVPQKAPYSTLKEMVEAAGKSRQGLSFASAGTGTPSHFAGELLKLKTKSNMSHVPYKGAGPALNDILGGHIDFYFPGLPAAMGNVRAGQMKLLAVSSASRSSIAPEAPTVAEAANLIDFDITLWVGFFVPRNTPTEIVTRLNEEINKILSLNLTSRNGFSRKERTFRRCQSSNSRPSQRPRARNTHGLSRKLA